MLRGLRAKATRGCGRGLKIVSRRCLPGGAGDGNRTRMASLEDLAAIKGLTCTNADLGVLGGR